MRQWIVWAALKLLALGTFVWLTNDDFQGRIELLVSQGRLISAVIFVLFWAFCLACLALAAFQPRARWRVFWALVIGGTSFVGYSYMLISGSELTIFDVASLWAARADSGRALSNYSWQIVAGFGAAMFGIAAIAARPPRLGPLAEKVIGALRLTPALPVLAILGIVFLKSGGGTHALPQQFAPFAEWLAVTAKSITSEIPVRKTVTIAVDRKPPTKHIVLLVGESVRPDFISLVPGNRLTPYLASRRDMIVDFGPAVSGNNCSHYANAILRLGAGANDVINTVNASPTIWQYAHKAGFRTVYINAAASQIQNGGSLQNFMTTLERGQIDDVIKLENLPSPQLDLQLAAKIAEILKRPEPQFIYANKNGDHLPYDESYPASERYFTPVMSTPKGNLRIRNTNSYANAVRWAVDGFFSALLSRTDLADTALIYTSDHGQNLDPARISHCNTVNPDPREGLVPMMVLTGDERLRARFATNVADNFGRVSHFALFPTVINLLGYPNEALGAAYGNSLFDRVTTPLRFTSGDIFGMFSDKLTWTPLDTSRRYRELSEPVSAANGSDPSDR